MSYDAVKNRMKYRNKSIWRCYLCSVCNECYKPIYLHPTPTCRDYKSEGKEVTFDLDKEWYQKDIHMMRYHQAEIVQEMCKKYLKQTTMGISP
jgi:hypothetical protein